MVDLGRLRGSPAREQPQGGDDRLAGPFALFGEEHRVERGRPARHRHTVRAVVLQGGGQREVLEHHGREAVQQQHHRVVGPGDVRVREGHRAHVVGGQPQRVGEAGAARDQRAVGVQHALGVGGGARGPVDPADGGAVGGRGGQDGRIAVRQRVVRLEDVLRAQPVRHRGVVEAAPLARDGEVLRLRLPQREADLTVAVEGDDRRLHGSDAGQREGQQGGLDPGGELPGDHRAGTYALAVQARRHPLGALAQLAEGQGAVLLQQDGPVGGEVGTAGDQFPQRARGTQGVCGVVHFGPLRCRSLRRPYLTGSQIVRRA